MKANDKRHGTLAGYRAHRNAKSAICEPCREAKNAYNRARQVGTRGASRIRTSYTLAGYDPDDALTGGRWMWDDQRAIRVWVETGEAA